MAHAGRVSYDTLKSVFDSELVSVQLNLFVFVKNSQVKQTKAGKPYVLATITDGKTEEQCYMWGRQEIESRYINLVGATINRGKFKSISYTDQLPIKYIEKTNVPDYAPLNNLVTEYEVIPSLFASQVQDFADKHLSDSALIHFFKDTFSLAYFTRIQLAPAAHRVHHAIKGGLIKHTKEMFDLFSSMYPVIKSMYSDFRGDICLIGILWHDLFKINDYSMPLESGDITCTENQFLLGHIYSGAHSLENKLRVYANQHQEDIPEKDILRCVHIILAHHGKLEWGSPVLPATKEAELLHHLDMISSRFNIHETSPEGEKSFFLGTQSIR